MSGQVVRLLDRQGEIVETDACPNCEGWQAEAKKNSSDVANLERHVTKLLARIKRLEDDKERERQLYAHRTLVENVFAFWCQATGHTKSKLDGDRFDLIANRINDGYTEEQCLLACIGAAVSPYVDPKKKRHDGVGLVFRNGEKLEDFALRAYRWGQQQMA